jgi:homoserine kinase
VDLGPDRRLEIAVDLEGHPDNVAACMFGGLALAYRSAAGWRAETFSPSSELLPTILIPEAERLPTDEARRVLPREVPLVDATFNLGRMPLVLLALTARPDLLSEALQDRLHQGYRLPLVPATRALFQDLRESGFPVCLSGSGPSLLVFEQEGRRLWDLGPGWRVLRPGFDHLGASRLD